MKFDEQIAAMSNSSVADDLILDLQSGIRTHSGIRKQSDPPSASSPINRFLYASRLPLDAPLLDFMDYALPSGFEVGPDRFWK